MLLHGDGGVAKEMDEGQGEVEESTTICIDVVLLGANACLNKASSARAKRWLPSLLLLLVVPPPDAPATNAADTAPALAAPPLHCPLKPTPGPE